MREIIRFYLLLEAETPIAHHSESIGNCAVAMREKIRQEDGSFANVPLITGDTMRHGLREAAAHAMLSASGIADQGTLTAAALRLLFAGGMITGAQDATRIDDYRTMSDLVPPLTLLGGCVQNRAIPGRINVDAAVLICEESWRFIPGEIRDYLTERGTSIESCRSHVEDVTRVRMDPMLDPAHYGLLADGGAEQVRKLKKREEAGEKSDAIGKRDHKSTMMPRSFETVVRGSLFSWSASCVCMNALEVDTWHTMVGEFLRCPVVGGKRGVGFGRLRPVQGWKLPEMPAKVEAVQTSLALPAGKMFTEHVKARADRVREWLSTVVA